MRTRFTLIGIFVALAGAVLYAQATRIQSSGTLPTNCAVGNIYIKTGSSSGFYTCIATNTWTGPYPTSSGGAPTDAQYWTGAADGTLSNEKNLGALSTGLVINTSGTPSAYAGGSCSAGSFVTSVSASGALTCGPPTGGGGVGYLNSFTAPSLGSFAWVNQGDATTDTTNPAGTYISTTSGGGGNDMRILKMSAPSTPYTCTAAFMRRSLSDGAAGMVFRESGTGELKFYQFRTNTLRVTYFSAPTSGISNLMNVSYTDTNDVTWLRIEDDGSSLRQYYHSVDGYHWQETAEEGRTTDLTANEVGVAVDPIGPKGASMLWLHWACN